MARRRKPRRSMLPRRGARFSVRAALLFALACASNAVAGTAVPPEPGAPPVAVRVERVRPHRETLTTLRFLRTNRDFFRSRLDMLRERPLAQGDAAAPIDPRFLAYRDMMNDALAATDSLGAAASDREHHALLASWTRWSACWRSSGRG
jgi:hypothetical protein